MTCRELFQNVIKEAFLGYIKIVYVNAGDEYSGTEYMANNLTALQMTDLFGKNVLAYYRIGEYWTVIV